MRKLKCRYCSDVFFLPDVGSFPQDRCWRCYEEFVVFEGPSVSDSHHDPVTRPAHYQSDEGIECIDAIRAALGLEGFVAHCRGTAIKYAWRAGSKGDAAECLRKGAWYLERAAQELEQ